MKGKMYGEHMKSGGYGSMSGGKGGPGAKRASTPATKSASSSVGAGNKGRVAHSGSTKSMLKAGGSARGSRTRP